MKELHLVHTVRNKRGENLGVLREKPGVQSWERQTNGDYLVHIEGDSENEYLIPASGVKFERRPKSEKPKAK